MNNLSPLKLGEKDNPRKVRRLKRTIGKLIPFILVIGIFFAIAFFISSMSSSTSVVSYLLSGNSLKSSADRVNVLLLGIEGGVHDGSNLTDSIMVASYNLKTNNVYFFSIPRDLWLPSLKTKVNAVYESGLPNNGLGVAKTAIGNILGIPIQYGVRIDIRGFEQAIDAVGGVDVLVDNPFDDYNFPIDGKEDDLCGYTQKEFDVTDDQAKQLNIEPGKQKFFVSPDGQIATEAAQEDMGAKYFTCRYEHVHFEKGMQHMDGATAMKYVRSRHGTNGEASDFARSKRQQKVIEAFRNKVLSVNTLANPQKLGGLFSALGKSIDTDISIKDGVEFYKLSKNLKQTHNFVLDNSPHANLINNRTSLLIQPDPSQYGGAFVLVSQDDDFSTIQDYVKKILLGQISDYEATSSARAR